MNSFSLLFITKKEILRSNPHWTVLILLSARASQARLRIEISLLPYDQWAKINTS